MSNLGTSLWANHNLVRGQSGPIYASRAETDVVWVVLFSEMVVSFQVKRCSREWYLSLLRLARAAAIWSSDSSSMCTVLTCFMMSAQ